MAVRFLTPNPADSATLTESSEASGFPAENVQDKRLPLVWKTGSDVTTLDDCESTDGWDKSADATLETLDNVTFKEGSNSINLGKDGVGSNVAEYEKTIDSPVDLTDKHAGVWVYVKDKTEFSLIQIRLGHRSASYFSKVFNAFEFTDLDADGDPWNNLLTLSGEPLQDWTQTDSPDITAIDYLSIQIQTAGVIAHGNIKMDFWRAGLIEFIEFDFTTAQEVTAAVIDGHDFDGTETDIKLDSSTDASTWTNRATFTFASGEAMAVFISSVSARYWRIIFTKALETDVRSIGRIFIGTYVQPTRGMRLGWRRTLTDLSQTKRSFGGTVYTDKRNKFWEVSFSISHEPEATLATLRSGLSTLGIGTPLWLALEPTANPNGPHTLYGYFTRPWSESEPLNDHFNVDFKFAEDL